MSNMRAEEEFNVLVLRIDYTFGTEIQISQNLVSQIRKSGVYFSEQI